MKYVIWDLDGTLADGRQYDHLLETKPKQWDDWNKATFHFECFDLPYFQFHLHNSNGDRNIIITARAENCRIYTENWLRKHKIDRLHHGLYMRRRKDFRPDFEVKQDIILRLQKEGFIFEKAYDDRHEVLEMYRRNGIPIVKAKDGQLIDNP